VTTETGSTLRPRILLNVPILNEIENIERLITGVTQALLGFDYVLLIVDDGSTDGTLEYVQRAIATHGGRIALLNRKKICRGCQRGAALLAGVTWGLRNGDFDVFVEMDGDLSHRTEELPEAITAMARADADIVIASKYVTGSKITGRSLGRTLISLICNFAVRTAIRWNIRDFSNGFRFYNRAAAELACAYSIRYGSPIYLTEVMALWLKNGLRVIEIPSHYVGRNEGWSKVRLRDYVKASAGVIEIAFRFRIRGFHRVSHRPAYHVMKADPLVEPADLLGEQDG
jgi:dolichol-phosphate mannosyltransferase